VPHTWSSADVAKWRGLAMRAAGALAESRRGPLASVAVMGDLARKCRSTAKVLFPTRDEAEQRTLVHFLRAAEEFATGSPDFRADRGAQLGNLLADVWVVLGGQYAGLAVQAPVGEGVMGPRPYYLRD